MIVESVLLLISMVFIAFSSEKAVVYVGKLSKVLRLSGTAAGFILLSVSTSLPEFFVAVQSALTNVSNFSVGNVFGANIADITLVIGVAALLSRRRDIIFKKKVHDELIRYLFISAIISVFLLQYGQVSFILGIVLLILFIFFAVKTPRGVENAEVTNGEDKYLLLKFAVSAIVLIAASRILVDNAVKIAEVLSIPSSVVGATIVSIGTTIPELTTTIQAFKKKLFDIGLSNAIGSCIVNSTLVLGINTIVGFKTINLVSISSLILFFVLSCVLTWYFVSTERRIQKKEAVILIGVYMLFIMQELGLIAFIFK